jgi:hypothetical protein
MNKPVSIITILATTDGVESVIGLVGLLQLVTTNKDNALTVIQSDSHG